MSARRLAAATAPAAIETTIMTVTPEQAEDWLGRNSHNRNLRNRHVEHLAGAIRRGEWQLNGDAIRFAADGTLLDGQHRLWAVIEADMPIQTVVITGLTNTTQITMDAGARRNLGDALKLQGVPNATKVAATLNYFWRWQIAGTIRNTQNRPTVAQALALLAEHPGLTDSARGAETLRHRFRVSASMIGAFHYVAATVDPDDADTFLERLLNGANLEEGNPILVLRRYLEQQSAAGVGARASSIIHLALIIKAWNAWRDGVHIDRLSWKASGMRAEAFPEVR